MRQQQVEARLVQEGDTLWHAGVQAWVSVAEIRRVPETRNWLALEVRSEGGKSLVLYMERDLKVAVRR